MSTKGIEIKTADGKLGVLLVGLGAVSTTFIAGVEAIKKGLGAPIGSLTQMGTLRLGKRTDKKIPKIIDFVPLASIHDLVFAAWDLFPDDAYTMRALVAVGTALIASIMYPAARASLSDPS